MPHRPARLLATGLLLIALSACAAPSTSQGAPDRVGFEHAVPVPVVATDGATPATDGAAPPADAAAPAPAPPGQCTTEVPAGASDAAKAYVAAVNAATPASMALDAKIVAADAIYLDDLSAQLAADATFVAALEAIQFPPDSASTGAEMIAAVHAYDDYLAATVQAGDFPADYADRVDGLLGRRSTAAATLRALLGVPASPCSYHRP